MKRGTRALSLAINTENKSFLSKKLQKNQQEVFGKKILPKSKRSQTWVEAVIYILIGFSIIGLILAYAKPKIDELQDRVIIGQSIGVMKNIDSTIQEIIQGGVGNKRVINLKINKGTLEIDGTNDKIIFEITSRYVYSEPDIEISEGDLKIITHKTGTFSTVTLTMDYSERYDIKYDDKDETKQITKSGTSYNLIISNKANNEINIKVE